MKTIEKMRKITYSLVENSATLADSEKCVASVHLENDQGYFNTYSHFGIHHEMLSVYYRYCVFENLKNNWGIILT